MCLNMLVASLAKVKAQVTAVSPLEGLGLFQAIGGKLCSFCPPHALPLAQAECRAFPSPCFLRTPRVLRTRRAGQANPFSPSFSLT